MGLFWKAKTLSYNRRNRVQHQKMEKIEFENDVDSDEGAYNASYGCKLFSNYFLEVCRHGFCHFAFFGALLGLTL